MLKVAIVGNIASGKSTIENFIKDFGYQVYDADKIAHKILETSSKIKICCRAATALFVYYDCIFVIFMVKY